MSGSTSESKSLERCVMDAIDTIQQWVSTPPKSFSCANGTGGFCYKRSNARYTPPSRTSSALFDLAGLEDSKYSEDAPFFSAVKCTGRGSEDCSMMSEDDDQMRRLGSWGTFGTIGTNESLDNLTVDEMKFDDDGNPIHPQLLEKAKQKREKLQQGASKKRGVKFAYPPISSLRQCPRIEPEDVDLLFFSDEELETYENDRRSAGTVDDIEIVAVSTSFSDEIVPVPPSQPQEVKPQPSQGSPSKKSGFSKFLPTPRARRALTEFQEPQKFDDQRDGKGRTLSVTEANSSSRTIGEIVDSEQPKEKRLLKSVQIFLRARSTA
jgi:hypothetical protein